MTTGISIRPGTINATIANSMKAAAITKAAFGSVSNNDDMSVRWGGFRAAPLTNRNSACGLNAA
jgi:hypothetical protein